MLYLNAILSLFCKKMSIEDHVPNVSFPPYRRVASIKVSSDVKTLMENVNQAQFYRLMISNITASMQLLCT